MEDELEVIPPSWRKICAAIRSVREEAGMTQSELGEKLGTAQSYVSRWETTRMPSPEDLWLVETVGLGVPAGTVYRRAGFVVARESESILEAIETDPALSPQARTIVAAAYQAALGNSEGSGNED